MGIFSEELNYYKELRDRLEYYYIVFLCWYYALLYNDFIDFSYRAIRKHPEDVKSKHQLSNGFIKHLTDPIVAIQHVDVREGRIFDPDVAGGLNDLINWQSDRPHYSLTEGKSSPVRRLTRKPDTHEVRREIWKVIYDMGGKVKNYSVQIEYYSKGELTERWFDLRDIPSYQEVISERMKYYRSSYEKAPYWYPLNYGTFLSSGDGYPTHEGLAFLEEFNQRGPGRYLNFIAEQFEKWINLYLDGQTTSSDPLDSFIKSKVGKGGYIKIFDFTRVLVEQSTGGVL